MSPPRSIWKSKEVSDYCHVKGMKFGLWVEIERLGAFSAAYAEHPEWRSHDILGRQSENFIDPPNAASDGDGTLSILEISSPDGASGALTVCTLMNAEADLLIRPRGIDIERTYEVTFDNSRSTVTVSGYELSTQGVRVSIPSARASELILYKPKSLNYTCGKRRTNHL